MSGGPPRESAPVSKSGDTYLRWMTGRKEGKIRGGGHHVAPQWTEISGAPPALETSRAPQPAVETGQSGAPAIGGTDTRHDFQIIQRRADRHEPSRQ